MSGDSTGLPDSASKRNGRSIWFHIHFWIGWIAAIPIALICFTGAALVFEQNLFRWEHKALYQLDTTGEAMSVAEVLEAYRSSDPPLRVNHLGIPQSPEYSYSAYCAELHPDGNRGAGRVFLNPYTGELSRLSEGFSLSHFLIDVHRRMASGRIGQQVAAISSLVLAITCIVGLILWWPLRGRTFVRAVTRGGALDWHNALGLVALVPLAIMAITGFTFTWGRQIWPALEALQDGPSQASRPTVEAPAGGSRLSIEAIVERALARYPEGTWTGFQPSNRDTSAHALFFTLGSGNAQLFLDPFTGEELHSPVAVGSGPATWYRQRFGRLHTLYPYGWVARILWGALSLGGTILVATGLWISLKRWRRNRTGSVD